MKDLINRNLYALLDWIVFILVVNYQLRTVGGKSNETSYRVTLYRCMLWTLLISFIFTGRGVRNMLVNNYRQLVYGPFPFNVNEDIELPLA